MKDKSSITSRLAARRPSPAMVVALVALFASTGGVSYAVATGSIGSREIKNSSIQGKDVGKNEITAREIARRSIDGTDVKVNRVGGNAVKEEVLEAEKIGKVSAAAGADTLGGQTAQQIIAAARQGGSAGPAGPAGPPGPAGPAGSAGPTTAQVPIAVFAVNASAALAGETHRAPVTGSPSATRTSVGRYTIDLPGYSYSNTNSATTCTIVGFALRGELATLSSSGDILVETRDDSGALTDHSFSCSVWDLG